MDRRYPALEIVFSKTAQFPRAEWDKPAKYTYEYEDPAWLIAHAEELADDKNHHVFVKTKRTSGEDGAEAERTWTQGNGRSIGVGDKFWEHPSSSRSHIIRHEALHDITDPIINDDEFMNLYREGAFGGTWQVPLEAATDILTDFIESPEWVREKYPKAYDFFMKHVPYLRGVVENVY